MGQVSSSQLFPPIRAEVGLQVSVLQSTYREARRLPTYSLQAMSGALVLCAQVYEEAIDALSIAEYVSKIVYNAKERPVILDQSVTGCTTA